MKKLVQLLLLVLFITQLVSCRSNWSHQVDPDTAVLVNQALTKAGDNAPELRQALDQAPKEQKKGVAFLIAYMPEQDLKILSADFILKNTKWAYQARETFPWCKKLPEEIFMNEVLPYASLLEHRDLWRPEFYARFEPYVRDCKDIYAAIDSVNRNIQKELGVVYNTKRSRVDISPFQAIKEQMATCTGLSFLLVDAFRSVGIPARFAGTAMWTNMRGNHSWVEVWIDGKWYFTEYYPDALNKSWFVADAGKADPADPLHWIYAVTYKPGNCHFPMSWAKNDSTIHARNVTDRYIRIYQQQLKGNELNPDELLVKVVLYENGGDTGQSDNRLHRKLVVQLRGKQVDFGYTPSPTDDLNRYLIFKLKKNTNYTFSTVGETGQFEKSWAIITGKKNEQMVRLNMDK